jgi:hypothetical protein
MSRSEKPRYARAIGLGVVLLAFGWASGVQAGENARAVLRDAGGMPVWST